MTDAQVLLDGTAGWISSDSAFDMITVEGAGGEVATISRPLGGSLLGEDIGFGVDSDTGDPYYDSGGADSGEDAVIALLGDSLALLPVDGGPIVVMPTS